MSHQLKRGRRRLPALLTAALAVAACAAPAAHANGSLSGGLDDQLGFGTDQSGFSVANTDAAVDDLGAQTLRVQFSFQQSVPPDRRNTCRVPPSRGASWADPASYDFETPKAEIANARRRGLRVLLVITSPFPCWASKDADSAGNPCAADPDKTKCAWRPSLRHYENFLRAVLSASGGVQRISLFNEPNSTKFLDGRDVYERALIYRDIWFTGRKIIETEFGHLAPIPLWFGEMAQSDNADTFLKAAFCFDGASTPAPDPYYQACDGDDLPVDSRTNAEALSFHTYLEDNSPQDNLEYLQGLRRTWSQIRNKVNAVNMEIGAPQHFVITEAGVHHGQSYQYVDEYGIRQTERDPKGQMRTPEVQAAHMNCLEHNMFRDPRTVGIVQYGLQDPPHGRGGLFFTGLRYRDGAQKPSYQAWRMPLTVYRPDGAASTNLRVWGAYRRSPRPASVTLVGLNGGVTYQRTIPLDAALYPNGHFITTLTDVPTAITRFQIRANGLTSREATPADCDQGTDLWNGGVPINING